MKIATEYEKAWLAGFIDGEGSFFIEKLHIERGGRHCHRPRFSVAGTATVALEVFISIYGGTLVKHSRVPENHKDSYHWHCPAKELDRLVQDVLPYLVLKRTQAQLILYYLGLGKARRISDTMWAKREEIRGILCSMNYRGIEDVSPDRA